MFPVAAAKAYFILFSAHDTYWQLLDVIRPIERLKLLIASPRTLSAGAVT